MKVLKRYLRRDRRRDPRHPISTDVEFYVWDTVKQKPSTGKAPGCLTAVSMKGACLQTNHLQIGGHHLFLDHDPRGKTMLAIELPSPAGDKPWVIQAKIISYDKFPDRRKYQFDVRLQFVNPSESDVKSLEQLIKSQTSQKSNRSGS